MRRKDREITDNKEILNIIDNCDTITIALLDGDKPYLLPMNFGYEFENEKLVFYFHSAKQGKKLDIINENNNVWFSMDCAHELITAEYPCAFTMQYASVIGSGKIHIIKDTEEQIKTLKLIMKKYTNGKEYDFEEKHTKAITAFKIEVSEYTAKRAVKK